MIDSLFKPYTHSALKSVNPPFLCFQKWQKNYSENFDENNCLSFCYTNVVKENFRPEGVLQIVCQMTNDPPIRNLLLTYQALSCLYI